VCSDDGVVVFLLTVQTLVSEMTQTKIVSGIWTDVDKLAYGQMWISCASNFTCCTSFNNSELNQNGRLCTETDQVLFL
jgi:hypothetical protein